MSTKIHWTLRTGLTLASILITSMALSVPSARADSVGWFSHPDKKSPTIADGAIPVAAPVSIPPQETPSAPPKEQAAKRIPLRVKVIDGRTQKPLAGAEVVLIETGQRLTTDSKGLTGEFNAPVIRNPKYFPLVAELHGQLGLIAYKNGYRDSVHLGVRINDGVPANTTIWMYKIGPLDRRIEPVLYQVPYHRLWLIELTQRFRSKTQPGEGPQRP